MVSGHTCTYSILRRANGVMLREGIATLYAAIAYAREMGEPVEIHDSAGERWAIVEGRAYYLGDGCAERWAIGRLQNAFAQGIEK